METLLDKQGPLAHVWLAANYDRKLSKQQLLSTNIVKTSKYIAGDQASFSASSLQTTPAENITLRLSGQLLLGIVRIYSRKTKYLLEDVNDILYKLKNSFRIVNSGMAASSGTSTITNGNLSILLPAQQTTIANVNQITLQDQVTTFDLLFQEDLVLDEPTPLAAASDVELDANLSLVDQSFNFNQSIEYPRSVHHDDDDEDVDIDLNLDFDLDPQDADVSIEVGRNAQLAGAAMNPDLSIDLKGLGEDDGEDDILDFGFDEPLETVQESQAIAHAEAQTVAEPVETIEAPPPAVARPKRKLVGITEEGQMKTVKRRLVVDTASEVETGIPIQELRSIQNIQLSGSADFITLSLTEDEKLQLINELSEPCSGRKRPLWDINRQLQQRCVDLASEDANQDPNELLAPESPLNYDHSLDFDIDLPDLQSDREADIDLQLASETSEPAVSEAADEDVAESRTKSTIQIAEHLRETFVEGEAVTTLSHLIERDLTLDGDKQPLGKTGASLLNAKSHATKCFFELLVLATNDCISIQQDAKDIGIRAKDNIYTKFL